MNTDSPRMEFAGKTVLITGGSKGIGMAAAKEFLLEGARVVVSSRSKENVDHAVMALKSFSANVTGICCDFSIEKQAAECIADVSGRFGSLDILVNSAGVSRPARVENISEADWFYVLNNNLTNCFWACKYAVKSMKKQKYGNIVNVSSIAGRFRSSLAGVHYTCAKSAVIALTRHLAAEVGPFNIRVNAICPGQTATEMLTPFLTGDVENKIKTSIPLGYIASPEQQARVIYFLASERSNYMTGAVVDVNGGQF